MSKTLTETFQALVNEPVNLSTKDVSGSYMKVAPQIDIDDYLGWVNDNSHKADYFHIILSVKVDQNSGFIPFYSILKGKSTTDSLLRGEILELGKNNITNNYSDFLSNFTFEKKTILRDVPRISFTYGVDDVVTNIHIGQEELAEGKTWLQEQPTDLTEENPGIIGGAFPQIREELSKDGSFAKVLSGFYRKSIDTGSRKELFFTSFNMDTDYQGAGFLTRLMVISTGKGEIDEFTAARLNKIREIVSYIRTRYVRDLWMKNNYEATKSAKAAIMSRNMSHNLGSHVMSYLKQQLGSITAITNDQSKVLSNLFPWPEDMSPETKKYMENKLNQIELPFLVGLGRFIGYLQERQDYIATIATDYIPYGAPVNLKDAIYDELNPDLRYMRHKDQSRNRPTNILLNYIAKSEGLSRERMKKDEKSGILKIDSEGDIRFGFIHYDGEGEARSFGFDTFDSSDPVLGEMRKINFNLPGGLVGRQAIFSIIENLIRNAAKHGDKTNAVNLDFAFDIIDGSQIKEGRCVAWEKRVGDARWRKLYEAAEDIDDLYLVTITDNLPNKKENVDYLQRGLYEGYVDENTGQMLTTNKGVKEMRISAAWLRGNTDESQYKKIKDDTGICAPLLAVELSPEGHLRNIICVHKNKTVVVVKEVEVEDGTKVAFDEKEINYFKNLQEQSPDCWNVFEDEKDEGGNVMESAVEQIRKSKTSYSFILCPDSEKAFDVLRPITSNRLLRWKKPQADIDSYSSDALLLYVYRLFTNIDERSEDIFIDDYSLLDIKYSKIRKVNSNEGVIAPEHAFLYRTHLGSKKDYMAFVRNNKNNKDHEKEYACAEGITGDNSSDRLIRREPLDERWYYNHLYALKKRIAIIDERIFKMVHNIDENTQLKRDGDEPVAIASLVGKYELDKVKRILIEKGKLSIIQKAKVDKANSFVELSSIVESASISLFEKKELDVEAHGSEYTTPFYKGKNIDVFTVIEGADGDMILVGCIKSTHEIDGDDVKFDNTFGKIATFVRNVSTGNVELIFENESLGRQFGDVYDYISVHQGILDKIYDNLGIKHNNGEKGKVTECIYRRLMRGASAIGDYLPNLIIHSGRAKPSEEDMPQKQPFVQFAAIENAVKDCKPMLVDLLDYAKYETN